MPSKCAYNECKRTKIHFDVIAREGITRTSTKHYCSQIHVVLGIMEEWGDHIQIKSKTTILRLYRTTFSLVKKFSDTVEKEWKKTSD